MHRFLTGSFFAVFAISLVSCSGNGKPAKMINNPTLEILQVRYENNKVSKDVLSRIAKVDANDILIRSWDNPTVGFVVKITDDKNVVVEVPNGLQLSSHAKWRKRIDESLSFFSNVVDSQKVSVLFVSECDDIALAERVLNSMDRPFVEVYSPLHQQD